MTDQPANPVLETTPDAQRLARTLLRTARSAAIATLDPTSGRPVSTRVGLSTDIDGTPTVLVSSLSAHARGLRADPRCSLLIGEPGRGDPLAHPRLTIHCTGRELAADGADRDRVAARYLAHSPKAGLYAGLGDFRFWRLKVESAALNGGFGRAFVLEAPDLLTLSAVNETLAEVEPGAIAHMNADHAEAVGLYATHFARAPAGKWVLVGIDAEGIDLADGDDLRRVFFPEPLDSADALRGVLARMAAQARGRS